MLDPYKSGATQAEASSVTGAGGYFDWSEFHRVWSAFSGGARFQFANLVQTQTQSLFESLVCRLVVCAAGKVVWEASHVGELVVKIVGVFVAFAIADVFHESGDGVAEVERNGIGFGFADVF